jgi:hypothetical protein
MSFLVRILYILLAVACVVLAYYGVIWFIAAMGLHVPGQIMSVLWVVFVLLGLIYILGAWQGKWRWPWSD